MHLRSLPGARPAPGPCGEAPAAEQFADQATPGRQHAGHEDGAQDEVYPLAQLAREHESVTTMRVPTLGPAIVPRLPGKVIRMTSPRGVSIDVGDRDEVQGKSVERVREPGECRREHEGQHLVLRDAITEGDRALLVPLDRIEDRVIGEWAIG
jgi:hypothetical protein